MCRYCVLRWPGLLSEQRRWLEHIEDHTEALLAFALAAYPEGSAEYIRARWTGIRLRSFVKNLRRALGLPSY